MDDPSQPLNSIALEVIRWLVTEIGPRPAGSPAECQAFEKIEQRLSEWDYHVERIPARFAPLSSFEPIFSLSAAAFIASAWLLPVFPWPAFVLPLLTLELPEIDGLLERRRTLTRDTQDLFALPNGLAPSQVDLLLVAHIDTARANPSSSLWRNLEASAFPAMQRLSWILAILGLLPLIGLGLPTVILYAVWIGTGLLAAGLIALDVWELAAPRPRPYSPGAHDNASGTGVLMAVARKLSDQPPRILKVGYLFTGAEETGMHGAASAANWLAANDAHPKVLVLDQVGAGSRLRFAGQVGRLRPLKTSQKLNELLIRAHPLITPLDYFRRSGDFEAFLRAGFEAASLERTGSVRAEQAYHTVKDNLTVIESLPVAETINTVLQFIWILEKETA